MKELIRPLIPIAIILLSAICWVNRPNKEKPFVYTETRYIGYVESGELTQTVFVPHSFQKKGDTLYVRSLVSPDSVKYKVTQSKKSPVLYSYGVYILLRPDFVVFYKQDDPTTFRVFSKHIITKDCIKSTPRQ